MRFRFLLAAFAALALPPLVAAPARAQPARDELAVEVRNLSTPDVCAEKDNVEIDFAAAAVRAFRVQAIHPAYIGTIGKDLYAPDFSSCAFQTSLSFAGNGQRVTLYETPDLQLVGYRLPDFWRPPATPVRVGDRTFDRIDVLQLWMRYRERAEEFLVLYPPDGYWRIRPLPFADMRWTAYGSSFLIGPVETQGRPIVDLKEIAFDPAAKAFTLSFRRGGAAKVTVQAIDQEHVSLDVAFDGALPADLPFASMRSMFSTETNADVARAAWRAKGDAAWRETGIMEFAGAQATEFRAGRRVVSRHNTSAPDMSFGRFSAAPAQ
ncbi:MAG: hypothetical protein KGM42_07035 [Hyphomicrobiales bacterium]|nr:hypothetical protein [Hyphomicrobiales bacterium]